MLISYVVRLRSDALVDGRFVGEVEAVTSRQRRSIRNVDQLAAFVLATMHDQVTSKESAREVVLCVDPLVGAEEDVGAAEDAGATEDAGAAEDVRGGRGAGAALRHAHPEQLLAGARSPTGERR